MHKNGIWPMTYNSQCSAYKEVKLKTLTGI